MSGVSRSASAVVAILAAVGVLFVLITPALDELPSTCPHAMNMAFGLVSIPLPAKVSDGTRLESEVTTPLGSVDLLSLTCSRLR